MAYPDRATLEVEFRVLQNVIFSGLTRAESNGLGVRYDGVAFTSVAVATTSHMLETGVRIVQEA